MKRVARIGMIVGSLFAFVAGFAGAASALDTEKLIEYYRRKSNIPPNASVTVQDVKDSPIAGAKQGSLVVGGRSSGFIASADGRYAVFGDLEDLSVDPFKAVMEKIDVKGRHAKGPADAPVTIVEYSDFQCPFCTRGYNTIEDQVLKEYGDKVRFYYKHFPLGFHKWAEPAGVGTECAADQNADAYWKLYSFYFENQKQINPENLKEKSKEALEGTEIDMAKWESCFDNNETRARVRADMAEGQSVGVTGTPGFIINGRLLSGAQPFQRFKAIIDDELSRAAN